MDYTFTSNFHANLLIDLIKIIHSAHNKDKIHICRAIDLSEKTIVDWYNEINHSYAPFRSHYILGKKMSDEKILSDFLEFAGSRTNSHAIEFAMQFLEQVPTKWNAGKLKKLIGDLDLDLFNNFCKNLKRFHDLVFDTKIIMLEDGAPKLEGNKEDSSRIEKWIKQLDKIRSEIRTNAMTILQQLQCNQEMFNKISNQNNSKK